MNKKYNKDVLEEMASKINLVDYIGMTEDLKEKSGKLFTICPLHSEKTASLCIFPDTNTWHCFGCGQGGDIYTWIMKREDKSFADAVAKVAQILNYTEFDYTESETIGILRKLHKKRQRTDIVKTRKELDFCEDYINRFEDDVPIEWLEEGISAEAMREYEVRIDKSGNRIVYPVYDKNLKFIGVKGRTRTKRYKELGITKYMNYHKIQTTDFFAGMKQAKDWIKAENEIIIFEGIKSCMKAWDYGFFNTVAAETSMLNEEQVKILIKMHVRDIVIAFDSDVPRSKIESCTKKLRRFANVYMVMCQGEKVSPVDMGVDEWLTVYGNKKKL